MIDFAVILLINIFKTISGINNTFNGFCQSTYKFCIYSCFFIKILKTSSNFVMLSLCVKKEQSIVFIEKFKVRGKLFIYSSYICVSCMFITTWQFGWMINSLWKKKKSKMLTLNKYYEALELCDFFLKLFFV